MVRYAIGLDIVDVNRFVLWNRYSVKALRRIFSQAEIIYCCSEPRLAAQRFAIRFALREALYKALSSWCVGKNMPPFLCLCRAVTVHTGAHGVSVDVDWDAVGIGGSMADAIGISCSLSHAEGTAGAVVLLFDVMQ